MSPRRGAARLRERLEGLVGGEHAVHGEAVEHPLHLGQLPHRSEGLEGVVCLGVVEVEVVAAVVGGLAGFAGSSPRRLFGVGC